MNELQLLTPTPEMGEEVMRYRSEYLGEMDRISGSGGLHHYGNYADYYSQVENMKTNCEGELVPATQYFAFVDGKIVGSLQIRHKLNDELFFHGGHVGYGVQKIERHKGYASKMLALALEKCRELGLYKILMTCDKDNIASAKTIIKTAASLKTSLFLNKLEISFKGIGSRSRRFAR